MLCVVCEMEIAVGVLGVNLRIRFWIGNGIFVNMKLINCLFVISFYLHCIGTFCVDFNASEGNFVAA